MKRKITLFQALLICLLAAGTTWLITFTATLKGAEKDVAELIGSMEKYAKIEEIQSYVDRYFVGEYTEEQALEMAAAGYVDGLGDQWSYYMTADEYEHFLEDQETEYVGIGVTVVYHEEGQYLLVEQLHPASDALNAGIKIGDRIVAVEDMTVEEAGYDAAVDAILGEAGTRVNITVERGEETLTFNVERRKLIKQYVYSHLLENNVGYIYLSQFAVDANDAFVAAVDRLIADGAESFVFDVRNNPGGSLDTLLKILDRILSDKDLLIEELLSGKREVYHSNKKGIDLPMVVLINSDSYSAAEFFGGVLQEYGAAKLVGTATTGKGYGQSTFQLSDGSAVKLSVLRYYTPEGRSLKETGVTPDEIVELPEAEVSGLLFGDPHPESDAQLRAALDILGQ